MDAEVEAVTEAEVETPRDTLVEGTAQPLLDATAYTLAETKAETQIDTVAEVKAETLNHSLAYWTAEVELDQPCEGEGEVQGTSRASNRKASEKWKPRH